MFTDVSRGSEVAEFEVSASTPRPAPLTLSALFGRVGLLAVLIGVAVFLILFGGNDVREFRLLAAHGLQTAGSVYDKQIHSGKSRSYYLYYTLDVAGYHSQDRASVNSDTYHATEIGGTIPITYLPAKPDIHRYGVVTEATADRAQTMWIVVGLAFTAMMAFLIWLLESQIRLEQRLVGIGVCTKAQIFSNTPPRRGSRSNQCAVVYRFETDDGRVIQKTQKVAFRRGRQFIPGDMYTALYLPSNPKKVALLGTISMVRLPFGSRVVG